MTKNELQRLIKIEDEIKRILGDELELQTRDVEFDIIPPQKMLEILAYRSPTNISNWKYGRDYEKQKTIYENAPVAGLPYELVINSQPARAYLMNNNTFPVQVLVVAHVYGHTSFFEMNRWFQNSRKDMPLLMKEANERFNKYEQRFGIDEVEEIVDAGHAIQFHCDPFDKEHEDEKRLRIFEQLKKEVSSGSSDFGDLTGGNKRDKLVKEEIERWNQKLWKRLLRKSPVEETEDIMQYIIDKSDNLDDWQRDILEVLKQEGIYYWPNIKTKFMNEGFATLVHEKIMNQLFEKGLLSTSEHADFAYSNSLVKADNPLQLNPYLLGSKMWEDIEDRWNKGRYGTDWEECQLISERENWDTKEMNGWNKVKEVMSLYTDWMFMQSYLTNDIVRDQKLYLVKAVQTPQTVDIVRRDDPVEITRKVVVNSFAHSGLPKIVVRNGNIFRNRVLELEHKFAGLQLQSKYTQETLKHIKLLWGHDVELYTNVDETGIKYYTDGDEVKVVEVKVVEEQSSSSPS